MTLAMDQDLFFEAIGHRSAQCLRRNPGQQSDCEVGLEAIHVAVVCRVKELFVDGRAGPKPDATAGGSASARDADSCGEEGRGAPPRLAPTGGGSENNPKTSLPDDFTK